MNELISWLVGNNGVKRQLSAKCILQYGGYLLIELSWSIFSVVVFQVCIQNRYKLNKKYRKWMNSLQTDNAEQITRGLLKQAKVFCHNRKFKRTS